MRDFKFKIWADNKFYDKCLVGNTNDIGDDKWTCPLIWLEEKKEWVHCDTGIVCQFTGICDMNGKEIYEGDIVKKETFYDRPPTYRKETFAKVKWIEKFACYFLVDNDEKIFWELVDDRRNIEVVGNEFENPELLRRIK